ncbi:hypothetical protein [Pedobacter ureilyticus]|uniref:Collagen-like protein n=1 Tax=Pedobacter ureilyticus TaxID=1393051 RepID=A0ABW9J9P3_9SPHI|nr:hypothetical protein [Pedobacter helvus]
MKFRILQLICLMAITYSVKAQNVAINTDGSSANTSAILDIKSTEKGLLIPRMTRAQRDAISSPATGLIFFQTDNTPGFYYNRGTAAVPDWQYISTGAVGPTGPTGPTGATGATGQGFTNGTAPAQVYITGSSSPFSPSNPVSLTGDVTLASNGTTSITNNAVSVAKINATGTAGNTTFLRGDGQWATPASGAVTVNNSLSGNGTSGSALGLNLGNSNTWTANQTFGGTFLITSNSRIAMTNSDNSAREFRMQEPSGSGSQYVGFLAPPLTNNIVYRLPAVIGNNGQVLSVASTGTSPDTGGSPMNVLEWTTPTTGSGPTFTNVSSNVTLGQGNQVVNISGNFTVTLPSSPTPGQTLIFLAPTGNGIINGNIMPVGSPTNSVTSYNFNGFTATQLIYNGTIWMQTY